MSVSSQQQSIVEADQFGNIRGQGAAAFTTALIVSQSAATAAATNVFCLRNSHATKKIYIQRLTAQVLFAGTGSAALCQYDLFKGTSVTATTGTAVTPVPKTTALASAAADVRVLDTGITLTGLVAQNKIITLFNGRTTNAATVPASSVGPYVLDFTGALANPILLNQNELIYGQLGLTAVIGDRLSLSIDFIEV